MLGHLPAIFAFAENDCSDGVHVALVSMRVLDDRAIGRD
jgi:hypothetical protein